MMILVSDPDVPEPDRDNKPFLSARATLQAAGFTTDAIGPVNPRCQVTRGPWRGAEHPGHPPRWDRAMLEAQDVFPDVFMALARATLPATVRTNEGFAALFASLRQQAGDDGVPVIFSHQGRRFLPGDWRHPVMQARPTTVTAGPELTDDEVALLAARAPGIAARLGALELGQVEARFAGARWGEQPIHPENPVVFRVHDLARYGVADVSAPTPERVCAVVHLASEPLTYPEFVAACTVASLLAARARPQPAAP